MKALDERFTMIVMIMAVDQRQIACEVFGKKKAITLYASLKDLFDHGNDIGAFQNDGPLVADCLKIASRLTQDRPVPELDALAPITNERDFEKVAKTIRDYIEKNEPEAGLDRIHTFIVKFFRSLCQQFGIDVNPESPLHSLFGQYVKKLRDGGYIESLMTERILKTSISTLESFNHVRNKLQILTHYDAWRLP